MKAALAEAAGLLPAWWSPATAATAWWSRPTARAASATPRGKKNETVVGDRVQWRDRRRRRDRKVEPRRNLFYRQDEIRTKSFAANLDQVLVLIAAEPEFSEMQLARALIAAEAERIAPADRAEQERPGRALRARLGPPAALPADGLRRAAAVAAPVQGRPTATPAQAPARQDHAGAGPLGRRQEHADQPAGAAGARRRPARSRRRSTPASTPRPAPPGTGWTPSAPRR
jgi:hypothetical protein